MTHLNLISRAWLKEAIHNFFNGLNHRVTEEDIQAYIEATPSAFEGMTNGEILEALFSTEGIYKDDDFIEFVFEGETHTTYFTRDFWDSPYKGVSK